MVEISLERDLLYTMVGSAGIVGQQPLKDKFNLDLVSNWKLTDEINKLKTFEFEVENTKVNRENIILFRELTAPILNPFLGLITKKTLKKGTIKFFAEEFAWHFTRKKFREGLNNNPRIKYHDENWFDRRYKKRRKILVETDFIDETHKNIPLQIHNKHDPTQPHTLSSGKFDGSDFVITKADGTTQIPHELELWDVNKNEYVIRFKVPELKEEDKLGYIYYKNPEAIDSQDKVSVWSNSFAAVFHMQEDPSTTNYSDSTGNGNTGVPTNVTRVGGHHGYGASFNGVNSKIDCGSDASIDDIFAAGGTFEVWVEPKSDGEFDKGQIASKDDVNGWVIGVTDQLNAFMRIRFKKGFDGTNGEWETTDRVFPINNQSKIVIEYDESSVTNDPKIYLNGKLVAITEISTPVGTASSDAGSNLIIGNEDGQARTFDGMIDEVRLHTVVRGESWHRIIHKNETLDTNERPFFLKIMPEENYIEQTDIIASEIIKSGNTDMPIRNELKISGLESHFPFNHNAADITLNHTATIKNPEDLSIVDGKMNTALKALNNGIIILEDPIDINGRNFAITCWFKWPLVGNGTSWHTLIRGKTRHHPIIVRKSDNHLGVFDHAVFVFVDSGFDLDTLEDGWHFLVAQYDFSNTKTIFYIDDMVTKVGESSWTSDENIKTLMNDIGGSQSWGECDSLRIYLDKILTETERKALYLANTKESNPVRRRVKWRLGDGKITRINDLISYWKFNKNLEDSKSGFDLIKIQGTEEYDDGKFGSALLFDENTVFSIKPENKGNFDFDINDKFTYVVRLKTSIQNQMMFITKIISGVGQQLQLTPNGYPRFRFSAESGFTNALIKEFQTDLRDNKEHLLIMTYDGSGKAIGLDFYLDGVLQTNTSVITDSLTGSPTNDGPLLIGSNESFNFKYGGTIDEIRIYNEKLTKDEIIALNKSTGSGIDLIRDDKIPQKLLSLSFTSEDDHIKALQKVAKTSGFDLWFDNKNYVVWLGSKGKDIDENLDITILQESTFDVNELANEVVLLGSETNDIQLENIFSADKSTKFDIEKTLADSSIKTQGQMNEIGPVIVDQMKEINPGLNVTIPYDQYNRFLLESGDKFRIADPDREINQKLEITKLTISKQLVKLVLNKPNKHIARKTQNSVGDFLQQLITKVKDTQIKD